MRNQVFAAIAMISGMFCADPSLAQESAVASLVACDRLAGSPHDTSRDGPGVAFEKIDTKAAIETCGRALASNPNHPRMLLNLGRAYDRAGQSAEAVRLYRSAADQGYAPAQLALGITYLTGNESLAKDEREAARLLRLAADQGNAAAETYLAKFYTLGIGGLDKNEREGVRLLQLAADQDLPTAQQLLGTAYATGWGGLAKDDGRAARLYKRAADQDDAKAQYYLGLFYMEGRGGLPRDDREAAHLFKLAADQGEAAAQSDLGVFYMYGRGGLPQDDGEAARLFKLAADQGNALGQNNLGTFYKQGRGGLLRDEREASRLFTLAAAQGDQSAQRNLARAPRWMIELPVVAALLSLVLGPIAVLELWSRRRQPPSGQTKYYPSFRAFYLNPSGRISRRQFWINWAMPVAVIRLALHAAHVGGIKTGNAGLAAALGGIATGFNLLILWPGAAVLAKRIHDRNKTGWLTALFYVPILIYSIAARFLSAEGPNGWPDPLLLAILLPGAAISLYFVVEFGFFPGTVGPNPYGPDPVRREAGSENMQRSA